MRPVIREVKIQEYHITEEDSVGGRMAVIYARDGRFERATYVNLASPYTLQDWGFLFVVAETIRRVFQNQWERVVYEPADELKHDPR